MNRIALSLILILSAAGCESTKRPPADPADKAEAAAPAEARADFEAGAPLEGATLVAVSDVTVKAEALAGKPVKVTGVVKDVCQHRGCWVEIADGDATVIAKSLKHDVLLPKDAKGKRIEVEGTLRIDVPSSCDHGAHGEKQAHGEHAEHGEHGEHAEHGEEGHECPAPKVLVEIEHVALYPAQG